jgi:hypothetical protein
MARPPTTDGHSRIAAYDARLGECCASRAGM